MLNIKLKTNNHQIELGQELDSDDLKKAGFRKLGWLGRLKLKPFKQEVVYWAKNPTISCFDDEFDISPILRPITDASSMYGTTIYLFFVLGKLNKVGLQVIGNKMAALYHFAKFCEIIEKKFEIKPADGGLGALHWKDNNSCIIASIASGQHFHAYWFKVY